VLFTGIRDVACEKAIVKLGGKVTQEVTQATHVVTDIIRRTIKLLAALSLGCPIVSSKWIEASRKKRILLMLINIY